jgi:hypothetical protein
MMPDSFSSNSLQSSIWQKKSNWRCRSKDPFKWWYQTTSMHSNICQKTAPQNLHWTSCSLPFHRPCNNKQYDDCEQRVKTAKQATVTMIPAPLWLNYTKLWQALLTHLVTNTASKSMTSQIKNRTINWEHCSTVPLKASQYFKICVLRWATVNHNHAMAQAIRCQPLIMEVQVQFYARQWHTWSW